MSCLTGELFSLKHIVVAKQSCKLDYFIIFKGWMLFCCYHKRLPGNKETFNQTISTFTGLRTYRYSLKNKVVKSSCAYLTFFFIGWASSVDIKTMSHRRKSVGGEIEFMPDTEGLLVSYLVIISSQT